MDVSGRSRAIRVAIADDHPLVRQGLCAVLEHSDGIELVAQASNGRELIEQVAEKRPDVVLVDIKMSPMDGLEAVRRIRAVYPEVKALMLSGFEDGQSIQEAALAGAAGFLRKTIPAAELVAQIMAVAPNRPAAGTTRLQAATGRPTKRELEVLIAMAEGKSNKEIARSLGIGAQTVKTHVSHILTKLQAPDRAGAVALAFRKGLVH
ncbi:MAG: response regulator transcription factor [Actinomycetota bacterium]